VPWYTSSHSSYRRISAGDYRRYQGGSEPPTIKGDILLCEWELLAPSFDLRACGEKSTVAVIARIAPISPFMAPMNPVPGAREAFMGRSTEP
jgi:hypothetical protein